MDQIRITNLSRLKTAMQAMMIADKPKMWVSLRQHEDLTLTFIEMDSDGFDGLSIRMPEDECIHAFLLVKGAQFKTAAQLWAYTNIRPSRQCAIIQLCFVGKESGISRAAAHQAHHSRVLSTTADCVAFGLMSDNVFSLATLLDKVTKDKSFHLPSYLTIIPNKGFFQVSGTPQSPFPVFLTSFVNVQTAVRVNLDALSTTNIFTDAFKLVTEIKHKRQQPQDHRRPHPSHFHPTNRQPPTLLPQIDSVLENAEIVENIAVHHPSPEKRALKDLPPSPPPRSLDHNKSKFHSAQLQTTDAIKQSLTPTSSQSAQAYPKDAKEKDTLSSATIVSNPYSKEYQITHINSVLMSDTSYLENLALPSSNQSISKNEIAIESEIRHIDLDAEHIIGLPAVAKNRIPRPVRPRSLLIRRFTQTDTKFETGMKESNQLKPTKHERSYSSSNVTQHNSPVSRQKIPSSDDPLAGLAESFTHGDAQNIAYSYSRDSRGSCSTSRSRKLLSRPSSTASTTLGDIELLMQSVTKIYETQWDRSSLQGNPEIVISKNRFDIFNSTAKLSTDYDASGFSSKPEQSSSLKDVEMATKSPSLVFSNASQSTLQITKHKPALNQLILDIALFSKTCELNQQIQFALQAFQSAIFDTVSAINHEINPEHQSICIFEERITTDGKMKHAGSPLRDDPEGRQGTKKLEEAICILREKLIRVAMTLVVNIGTDKGLIYSDVSHMINAVSIFLPAGGLKILRRLILQPIALDLDVLINEGSELISFCNKI